MDILRKELEKTSLLTDQEWDKFLAITKTQVLDKGAYFLTNNNICQYSAFVVSGVLRHFLIDTKGNEKITQFSLTGEFVSDCESFMRQKPSECNIQAIEKCELVVFKNVSLQDLSNENSKFDKIGRQVTHKILSNYKEHLMLLLNYSPEEKYKYILDNKPELVANISVTHLSQFLGLTRETLSRLRGRVIM
jgi:CRP-like cAMP-binding protein